MSGARASTKSPLIKRWAEFRPKADLNLLPGHRRGIYVLFSHILNTKTYNVVYVGLSRASIRARLKRHRWSKKKTALWTHFSLFEVHRSVSDRYIGLLEGLFRQIYRWDDRANSLNRQKTHRALRRVRNNDLSTW